MWTKVVCSKCAAGFQLYVDTKKMDLNNWVCKNCNKGDDINERTFKK